MPKARQTTASAKPKAAKTQKKRPRAVVSVHPQMNVLEVIALHPDAAGILEAYGLHCHGCAFGALDSLETGARTHGLTDTDIENMVNDLNDVLQTAPSKPQTLTLTTSAAEALLAVAKGEGKSTCILRVTSDDAGGFCMEFAERKEEDDAAFHAEGVRNASLIANAATLARIGGSTVDFRDGRFKLDLASANQECGCGGNCACR